MHHFFEAITNTSGESLIGYFARVINPGTQGVVTLAADDNGTPIITVSGIADMAKTDDYGNLSFYVAPGTNHLDIYAADATTFVYRVSNVAMNSSKGDTGDQGPTGLSDSTVTSVADVTALPTAQFKSCKLVGASGVPDGQFNYETANAPYSVDGVNTITADVATTAGAWVRQKADGVTFRGKGTEAIVRSIASKLDDMAISVMDFMTPEEIADARTGAPTLEVTHAFQAAFDQAQLRSRNVFVPDGKYLVGNLLFGEQNQTGQSLAPIGLIGQSKAASTLKAIPGLTGTLLKSQSLAGITFKNFGIETTGSSAVAWDARWHLNGRSTQNVIEHIFITVHDNFTDGATAHVNWDDLNDTYPLGVTVRPGGTTSYTNCYISMVQSGGLSSMSGCIWTGGWLNFGCQNGELIHCWGHGTQFAAGCLNHVAVYSGYNYGNPNWGSVYRSESRLNGNSVRSLIVNTTEKNSVASGVTSYFDINLLGLLKINGCEFIGSGVNLMGPKARGAGVGAAMVIVEGGTHDGHLVLNDVPGGNIGTGGGDNTGSGINIECKGFMNATTGQMVTKNIGGAFTPIVAGATSAGTASYNPATEGSYTVRENLCRAYVRLIWGSLTGTGQLQIKGFRLNNNGKPAAPVLSLNPGGTLPAGSFGRLSGTTISFYSADGTDLAVTPTGNIEFTVDYDVAA